MVTAVALECVQSVDTRLVRAYKNRKDASPLGLCNGNTMSSIGGIG
jgi:hypothetical protein